MLRGLPGRASVATLLAVLCVLPGWSAEGLPPEPPAGTLAAADRARDDSLAAYQAAVAADGLARPADARRLLTEASRCRARAVAGYHAVRAAGAAAPDIDERLSAALAIGRACCGTVSLFERYAVE